MALTIQELFGTNANLDTSGATPTLTIDLTDFAAESLNGTSGYSAGKVAATLVRKWFATTESKTDDATAGVTVSEPFVSLTTRNGVAQRVYQYSVSVYVPDSGAAAPDPDLVP